MSVGTICETNVDLALEGETVHAAAVRMADQNVGTLVVQDRESCPVGIVTDRDLVVRVLAKSTSWHEMPLGDVMTPFPATVHQDDPVEDVLARMRSEGVRRLPVVDDQDQLYGIISVDDLLAHLAEEFNQLSLVFARSSPGRAGA